MTRDLVLKLDELDWETIQNYIADYQRASHKLSPNEPTIVPDGESNLSGAIMAECVRDLLEYRAIWTSEHPEIS